MRRPDAESGARKSAPGKAQQCDAQETPHEEKPPAVTAGVGRYPCPQDLDTSVTRNALWTRQVSADSGARHPMSLAASYGLKGVRDSRANIDHGRASRLALRKPRREQRERDTPRAATGWPRPVPASHDRAFGP